MARPSRFNVRLQSLVLLVLIPGLLLATALLGWSTYRAVYGIIMNGFDQKLYAVSTVTGSFIRGEDHDRVFEPRQLVALSPGAAGEEPLGLDSAGAALLRVDPVRGGAHEIAAGLQGARALAADPDGGAVWVATDEPAALHRFDPATGESRLVAPLAAPPAGLAYDAARHLLYAGGERLTAIDPATGRSRTLEIAGLAGPVRAPAMAGPDTLLLLGGEPEELIAVDLAGAAAHAVGALHFVAPEGSEEAGEVEPATAPFGAPPAVRALVVTGAGELLGAAGQLVRIDRSSAAVDSAGTAPGYRSYRHPLYQRYVGPMQRVMERKDISYLYTEMVGLGGVLTYGIDATPGEDHSIIGTTEPIADDEIPAMERAMVEGKVRLSDIENWDAWGLLKTADAPIYREDGRIAALAGADVDISLILDKTRVALVKVGVLAALTLLLGALVSLFISRRLVAPLTEVKEGALQLAAGQYGHRIADQQLLELRDLSESFNSMSDALAATIGELTRTNRALETIRRGQALEAALAEAGWRADPGPPFLVRRPALRGDGPADGSGFLHLPGGQSGRVILWMADPVPGSALANLRLQREVAALAGPLVEQHADDWAGAAAFLAALFPHLHCLALLDGDGRTVRAHARRPAVMVVGSADGSVREVDLSTAPEFVLGDSEWAVLAARDARAAAEAVRRGVERDGAGEGDHVTGLAVALFGRGLPLEAPAPRDLRLPAPVVEGVDG